MSKPQIFVSSTYYDLMHIRDSMELFIDSLGYEAILSERGSIPYIPGMNLDKSCYNLVKSIDIFVLIIGGRRGSNTSAEDEDESVVQKEFKTAIEKNKPVYTLIYKNVYSEYQTFLKNKNSTNRVEYAHVDDEALFKFIEDIEGKRRDLPIHSFSNFQDISDWLRSQWAGFFHHLLEDFSKNEINDRVEEKLKYLEEQNKTTQSWVELLVKNEQDEDKIEKSLTEGKGRLEELDKIEHIRGISPMFFKHITYKHGISTEDLYKSLSKNSTLDGLAKSFTEGFSSNNELLNDLNKNKEEINRIRVEMGLQVYE